MIKTRCFMVLLGVILGTAVLPAQTVSDPDLKRLVGLWQSGDTDSLEKTLPLYQKKYSHSPEVMYLTALFHPDGTEAVKTYDHVFRKYPDHLFAEHSLFRIIQYHAALGTYQAAESHYLLMRKNYPGSGLLARAAQLLPGNESGKTGTVQGDTGAVTYALQVGAFSARSNAEQHAKTLRVKGLADVTIGEKTVNGKKLFTVLIGSYADKDQASAAGQNLKKEHRMDYSIVIR